jgi:hypothetical protein
MYLIKGEQNQGLLSLSFTLTLSYLSFFYVWSKYPSLYIVLYMSSYLNKPNLFPCVGHLSYKWCGINILQSILSRVFFLLLSSFSVSMWITDNLSRVESFDFFDLFRNFLVLFFPDGEKSLDLKVKRNNIVFEGEKRVPTMRFEYIMRTVCLLKPQSSLMSSLMFSSWQADHIFIFEY